MCLDFPLYTPLYAQANVAWLSQCIDIADKFFELNRISKRRSLIHSAFFTVAAKVINSDFMIECVVQVYFLDP